MSPLRRAALVGGLLLLASSAAAQGVSGDPKATETSAEKDRGFEHVSVRFGAVRADIRGFFQTRTLDESAPDEKESDGGLDVAHRRVGLHGSVAKAVDFQAEGEIATRSGWRDLYIDYRQFDLVRVEAGHFKVPFGLDENTSAADLDFAFRSESASELAPGRQWGVMAHGRIWKRVFDYEVGLFQNARTNLQKRDDRIAYGRWLAAERVTAHPFGRSKSLLRDLQIAAAFADGPLAEGISDLRGRSTFSGEFFPRIYWVNGSRRRRGVEARWRPGPISVAWEYMRLSDDRREQGSRSEDLAPLTAAGWYVSGTWAVTGDSKARGLDKPSRPLFQGGAGAIEIAARAEHLRFGDGIGDPRMPINPRAEQANGNGDRLLTVGVNWYLNRWVKLQADVIREALDAAPAGSLSRRGPAWSQVLQLQLAL